MTKTPFLEGKSVAKTNTLDLSLNTNWVHFLLNTSGKVRLLGGVFGGQQTCGKIGKLLA